jgi:dTDP-4-amino-4,6-dideoxygalactose transaminase
MSDRVQLLPNILQNSPGAFFQEHRAEIMSALGRVVDSGWYILGKEVDAFEREFASRFELGGAVGVGNGTDAITLALRGLGVGAGDRVATVSHTAVATVAGIELAGATPVFVDTSPDTYTMAPDSLLRTLEAYGPIKAVIVVHLYGHAADMDALVPIAREFNASLIEDCAQAHGAKLGHRNVGSMGDAATFSFYPTKNLGALGDGGLVAASDSELIRKVRMLREYGWEKRYISDVTGMNSRLDELQAAILRIRLNYLEEGNLRRAAIAHAYNGGFADSRLVLPVAKPGCLHVYHQYVVQHPERDNFQARLKQAGIGTNIHYPVPVHKQPAYAGRCGMDPAGLENTETAAAGILSMPMYPELSDEAVSRIVDTVRSLA